MDLLGFLLILFVIAIIVLVAIIIALCDSRDQWISYSYKFKDETDKQLQIKDQKIASLQTRYNDLESLLATCRSMMEAGPKPHV